MTAHWESTLNQIADKTANYHGFIQPLTNTLEQLVTQASQQLPESLRGLKSPTPAYKKSGFKKRRRKKAA